MEEMGGLKDTPLGEPKQLQPISRQRRTQKDAGGFCFVLLIISKHVICLPERGVTTIRFIKMDFDSIKESVVVTTKQGEYPTHYRHTNVSNRDRLVYTVQFQERTGEGISVMLGWILGFVIEVYRLIRQRRLTPSDQLMAEFRGLDILLYDVRGQLLNEDKRGHEVERVGPGQVFVFDFSAGYTDQEITKLVKIAKFFADECGHRLRSRMPASIAKCRSTAHQAHSTTVNIGTFVGR